MPDPSGPSTQSVLLFDGDCGFCQACVDWILERSTEPWIVVTLGSAEGRDLLLAKKVPHDIESVVVVEGDRVLTKSDAVIALLAGCRFPWRMAGCGSVVPRRLRDALYDLVARHRHRLSPKGCRIE